MEQWSNHLFSKCSLVIDTQTVTEELEWSYLFADLAQFDSQGVAFEYTVQEVAVEGYEATVTGYDITNLRIGTTSVEGSKTWKDDTEADRPESIWVNLIQNGIVIETKEVTAQEHWTYQFTNLAQYDEYGVA